MQSRWISLGFYQNTRTINFHLHGLEKKNKIKFSFLKCLPEAFWLDTVWCVAASATTGFKTNRESSWKLQILHTHRWHSLSNETATRSNKMVPNFWASTVTDRLSISEKDAGSLTCEGVSVSLMGCPSNLNLICLIESPCMNERITRKHNCTVSTIEKKIH